MKRKTLSFWLVLGTTLLVALNLPVPAGRALKAATRDALAPMQALVASYANRLRRAGEAIRGWGGLPEQNQALQEEVSTLRQQLLEVEDLRRENLLLRQQLGFPRREARRLVPGLVLARDISGWWHSLRLEHGGSPLVAPDQAVVTPDGLVGRTMEVSSRTADVLLISDPSCRVSVSVGERAAHGVLVGEGMTRRGEARCRLTLVARGAPIAAGDEVFTSGLGGVYPAGIRVGVVETVTPEENGLLQSGEVRPSADLADLQVLFVVAGGTREGGP